MIRFLTRNCLMTQKKLSDFINLSRKTYFGIDKKVLQDNYSAELEQEVNQRICRIQKRRQI